MKLQSVQIRIGETQSGETLYTTYQVVKIFGDDVQTKVEIDPEVWINYTSPLERVEDILSMDKSNA